MDNGTEVLIVKEMVLGWHGFRWKKWRITESDGVA